MIMYKCYINKILGGIILIKKILLIILAIFLIFVVYLCLPEKKVATPDSAITLDTDAPPSYDKDFEYLSESNYADTMFNKVNPYLDELCTNDSYFAGYDGESLHYKNYIQNGSKAHVVFVHGFTDYADKYNELIYYFLKNGYSVSIMEHRGHGYSHRYTDDLSKVTIKSFDEYTNDFDIFVETIVKPSLHDDEKLFAFAHSMGGAIATLYMIDHPDTFDCAILNAPMMEIEFAGIPNNLANLIVDFSITFGMKNNYIIGFGPFSEEYDFEGHSVNSEERYKYIYELQTNNKNYQTTSGSYIWIREAIDATNKIKKNASKYTVDTLLFQASDDTTVGPNGQNYFVNHASNVSMIVVKNTKHSIFYAGNDVIYAYMDTILNFYDSHID